ncbi:hypothetical protein BT69DRAFT_1356989 [Atractiella rhizophila]|nr:hypothetical protein BT69DRAFT_1356989 [Atractiella rhizophila]
MAQTLDVLHNHQPATLIVGPDGLRIKSEGKVGHGSNNILSACLPSSGSGKEDFYAFAHILNLNVEDQSRTITLHAFASLKASKLSVLRFNIPENLKDAGLEEAKKFANHILELAYQGAIAPPNKRSILFIVNPFSGQAKGQKVITRILPWFKAAGIAVKTELTKHAQHASEIAAKMSLDEYDTITTVSGDGLIYEVVQGLANRPKDAWKALKTINFGVIPAGSANAVSVSMRGPVETRNMVASVLAVIKGKRTSLGLSVVTTGTRRIYCLLSQVYGIISDLDIDTEHLRWMGESRFVYGFIRGALQKRHCDGILEMKLAPNGGNKRAMLEEFLQNGNKKNLDESDLHPVDQDNEETWKLPALKYGTVNDPLPEAAAKKPLITTTTPIVSDDANRKKQLNGEDGRWLRLDLSMVSLMAGKLPYLAYNLMAFPLGNPADSYIDVHIIPKANSVGEILSCLDGTEATGGTFWKDTQSYYKVEMYRFTPKAVPKFHKAEIAPIAFDGEYLKPYEAFQVECLPGALQFLTLDGWYLPPDHTEQISKLKQ